MMEPEYVLRRPTVRERTIKVIHLSARFCVIALCIGLLCTILQNSERRYEEHDDAQVYTATETVDKTRLEITVCPFPAIEPSKILNFGRYYKIATNVDFNTFDMENSLSGDDLKLAVSCLEKNHFVHEKDTFLHKMEFLRNNWNNTTCSHIAPDKAIEGYTFRKTFNGFSFFGLSEEMQIDEFDAVYRHIDLLRYDNTTVQELLEFSAQDLHKLMISDFGQNNQGNFSSPSQKITVQSKVLSFGPNCRRYIQSKSHKILHQRYQLKLILRRTTESYLLVFINTFQEFSDLPVASILRPYRIPMDKDTVLHIRRIEKTTQDGECRSYGRNESRAKCVELCLLKEMVNHEDSVCVVPWMKRDGVYEDIRKKKLCDSLENVQKSVNITKQVLYGNTSKCRHACLAQCEQHTILMKVMGVVNHVPSAQLTHTLTIVVSNLLDQFKVTESYDSGQFISEVLGTLSFMLGIALVALIDWLVAILLWMCGKLPYIPSMPPLINEDIYPLEVYYSLRWEFLGRPMPLVQVPSSEEPYYHSPIMPQATRSTFMSKALLEYPVLRSKYNIVDTSPVDGRASKRVLPSASTVRRSASTKFPRLNQRKSSLVVMTQALVAATHKQSDEEFLHHQFSTEMKAFPKREIPTFETRNIHKRSSYPLTSKSLHGRFPSRKPLKMLMSYHGMPAKWTGPNSTRSNERGSRGRGRRDLEPLGLQVTLPSDASTID
ncbi:uncharacterized protein LOC119107236 [Pollicipes pollicipes]|uniref:uncharacterized protein LOC119107236 n=1 Tax=Pollicipes pollicipes TaxID=41117 RepID=UPI0018850C4B|nr:uncharacterized protein LOC119107236 [Pollicipes pollicipes]